MAVELVVLVRRAARTVLAPDVDDFDAVPIHGGNVRPVATVRGHILKPGSPSLFDGRVYAVADSAT